MSREYHATVVYDLFKSNIFMLTHKERGGRHCRLNTTILVLDVEALCERDFGVRPAYTSEVDEVYALTVDLGSNLPIATAWKVPEDCCSGSFFA